MAERDVMLVAIEMDAKGAITQTEILDKNFKTLSQTFRKGTQDAEKLNTVMAKQVKVSKQDIKSQTDRNVSYISGLAALEATTSGLNQLISAEYKKIDADLAAGKITAEEAEKERKAIKQKEYYTGRLEQLIAVMRLLTVTHMVYTGVVGMMTTATTASTVAVTANTVAWYANPMFWAIAGITIAILGFVAALAMVMDNLRILERALKRVNDEWAKFFDFIKDTKDFAANFDLGNVADTLSGLKDDLMSGRA